MSEGIYTAVCFVIGCLGIGRRFGFWGYFFGSLLFTPFIGAILVLGSDKRKKLKQAFNRRKTDVLQKS